MRFGGPNWLLCNDVSQRKKTATDLKDVLIMDMDSVLDEIYMEIPASVFPPVDKAIFFIHPHQPWWATV